MRSGRLHLRLFLEGIEVPIISAVVTGGVNQPATAAIQIVPTDDVHRLLPRTLVHLFFLDLLPDDTAAEAASRAETVGYDGLTPLELDAVGDNYRLLFAGEMVAYAFEKSDGSRSCVLQCLDFSGYWDVARQYFHTGGADSPASKAAAYVGSALVGSSEEEDEEKSNPVEAIMNVLERSPASVPELGGLLGGVIRLLELIGGIYRGQERFRGLNDFFSAAELRLGLSRMIGASPYDTSSKKLINHKTFRTWIRQVLARNRNLVSFREIVDTLLQRIYHDYVSVPAPCLRPEREVTVSVTKYAKRKLEGVQAVGLEAVKASLETLIRSGDDDTLAETRELTLRNQQALREAVTDASKIGGHVDSALGRYEGILDGLSDPNTLDTTTIDEARKTLKVLKKGLRGKGTQVDMKGTALSRLVTHVFRPNIFFAPPPRCNVLWPDTYDGFSYRRNYLQEITRLQLVAQKEWTNDSVLGIEGGQKKKYWAPNVPNLAGQLAAASAQKGARFIMPHEKFTGIVPRFDHISDISAFQEVDADQEGRDKIPYMQRIANYDFFLYRFGPRTASISSYFSPYLVPGLPALIVDRHRSDAVRTQLGIAPTQYLGTIDSLTHTVSQQGGRTSVSLSHCRTHDENLEFLGPFIRSFSVAVGSKMLTRTISAAVEGAAGDVDSGLFSTPEKLVGVEIPGLGKVTHLLSTYQHDVAEARAAEVFPSATSSVERSASAGAVFSDSGAVVGVRKTLFGTKSVEYTPEEGLFPGWMSPIYKNLNIGRMFYQEMIGVGSIVDPVTIGLSPRDDLGMNGIPHLPLSVTASEAGSLSDAKLRDFADRARAKVNVESADPELRGLGVQDLQNLKSDDLAAEVQLGATVRQAVDAMVRAYAALKDGEKDFDAFFREYGWRPIASMTQILGSADLRFPGEFGPVPLNVTAAEQGTEGFHSRAFGPYTDLALLDHVAAQRAGGLGMLRQIDGGIDPRKERYEVVRAYATVLSEDRGALG